MADLEMKARLYHALGELNRLGILEFMLGQKEPVCICRISEHIGRDQSVAFRHIQLLRDVGLVSTRKKGPFLFCSLKEPKRIRELIR
jgi:ArsR family transcriptional regulator, arsenate/arsenite/antimonite-responsive transcriptional repressor